MHDFAKLRKLSYSDRASIDGISWSIDIPSILSGILVGILMSIFTINLKIVKRVPANSLETEISEVMSEKLMKFEFYDALSTYEVLPRKIK